LRSSPTPEGRCCLAVPVGDLLDVVAVAILTDPGGSVLPCSLGLVAVVVPRTVAILTDPGGSVLPLDRLAAKVEQRIRVAILTDPGGSVLPGLPVAPVHPDRVAILTDPGGSVLLRGHAGLPRYDQWMLRSSPTPEGRCCRVPSGSSP